MFNGVKKHFNGFYDDMFDFHGYCVRKTTLRAYLDVLKMQDNMFYHKFFQRASRGALKILLHLLDFPEDVDGLGHLPSAERKKRREKIKKQRKKEEAAASVKEVEEKRFGKEKGDDKVKEPKEEDPDASGE